MEQDQWRLLGDTQGRLVHLKLQVARPRERGFTLIELMIAVVIAAFLILLAGPMYADFVANARIRNAGEALLNGVRQTQAEAVRRNTPAWFVLDPAVGYKVYAINPEDGLTDDDSDANHRSPVTPFVFAVHGAADVTVTGAGSLTTVTFDGLGRIIPNADATASLTQIDITSASGISGLRNLRVAVTALGSGGGTKLCDPAMASTDPAGCPP
jgi:prepilin-type N-terminal cleavage/methylation domain-containing protein